MEMMEKIFQSLGVTEEDKKKLVDCKWNKCEKTHLKKIQYPGGGTVKKNSSYSDDWVSAGLEPWVCYKKKGKNSKPTLKEYREETKAAKYAVTAAAMVYPEYHTQKHHLLAENFFKNFKTLKKNAKLVGWDINNVNNGMCLPSYVIDIVRHDLQCHRGNHPKVLYNDKVKAMLQLLEDRCVKYCQMDVKGDKRVQLMLKDELDQFAERVRRQIKLWNWLLRKDALKEREESKERFNNLNKD